MAEKVVTSFDGTRIAYMSHKGEGTPIVLVHGLTGSCSGFLNTFNFLKAKGRSVITFDLRGHGFSEKPKEKYRFHIDSFAKDIHAILQKEKIKKIYLVGHCFGALVCMRFVDLYPNSVERLLLSSMDYAPRRHLINWAVYVGLFFLEILFFFLPREYKVGGSGRVDYTQFKKYGDWYLPRMSADMKFLSTRVYFIMMRQILKLDLSSSINSISMPTLIVHGDKDSVFNVKAGIALHHSIKGSQLVILKGNNHAEHIISATPKINDLVYSFMGH